LAYRTGRISHGNLPGDYCIPAILRQNAGIHDYIIDNPGTLLVISLLYSLIPSYREEEHKPLVICNPGMLLSILVLYIHPVLTGTGNSSINKKKKRIIGLVHLFFPAWAVSRTLS
jgi:hypothetical protein